MAGKRSDHAEWRYLRRGQVVHALSSHALLGEGAACGVRPAFLEGWLGTGLQREYERAAELPRCRRCLARLDGA